MSLHIWNCILNNRIHTSIFLPSVITLNTRKIQRWVNSVEMYVQMYSYNSCLHWNGNVHVYDITSATDESTLSPWRWRRYVPPKRLLTQYLYGATFQKMAFFVVTAVKTSKLARWKYICESDFITSACSFAFSVTEWDKVVMLEYGKCSRIPQMRNCHRESITSRREGRKRENSSEA
jgi:hypothetical protein